VICLSILQFTAPPLPYYIESGFTVDSPGFKHRNRRNMQVFDLLVITEGCLYMGEEDRHFELSAGSMLILRPNCHHYPTAECRETTAHFWLHFLTAGKWELTEALPTLLNNGADGNAASLTSSFTLQTFMLQLPQFAQLVKPAKIFDTLQQLTALGTESHQNRARWRQQLLFQGLLEQLHTSMISPEVTSTTKCADLTATFLRQHYQESLTAEALGEALNFHPVYIARCMQKEFGCSPFDYLLRYRLEQAKLLLLQTELPISRIAEEVGFNQAAYFTSCFVKYAGVTPRNYRQSFM
jgi:AraC-like DNA-binding protein